MRRRPEAYSIDTLNFGVPSSALSRLTTSFRGQFALRLSTTKSTDTPQGLFKVLVIEKRQCVERDSLCSRGNAAFAGEITKKSLDLCATYLSRMDLAMKENEKLDPVAVRLYCT